MAAEPPACRNTCQVGQSVERHVLVVVQEHLDLPHADPQVRLVELVRDVPTCMGRAEGSARGPDRARGHQPPQGLWLRPLSRGGVHPKTKFRVAAPSQRKVPAPAAGHEQHWLDTVEAQGSWPAGAAGSALGLEPSQLRAPSRRNWRPWVC